MQAEEEEEQEAKAEVVEREKEAQRAQKELSIWQEKLSKEQVGLQEKEKGKNLLQSEGLSVKIKLYPS